MFDHPELTLAFPSQPAETFWNHSCRRLGPDQPQIIGMDGDHWLAECDIGQATDWVTTLRSFLSKPHQERVFLTTIVFLVWPKSAVPAVEEPDRFRALALAGANLRLKQAPPYDVTSDVTIEQFAQDLAAAKIIAPLPGAPPVTGMSAPQFSSEEEEKEHQERMRFYGSPPFTWTKKAIDELYGKHP